VLEASGVIPLSAAARTRPTERTIRFYVARGLVSPPDGRGTAAMYGYKHFLQVLAIKLRQMEGATLDVLTREFAEQAGDQLERRVASVLGPQLPPPGEVAQGASAPSRGRGARAMTAGREGRAPAHTHPGLHRRIHVAPGVELLIDASHPAFDVPGGEAALVAALRAALAR
jgi:DNA-binding transcriptional MerR regulator